MDTPLPASAKISQIMNLTDITPWVRALSTQVQYDVAVRVLSLHLGADSSSAFIERFFSTTSKIWNSATSSLSPHVVEQKAILRQARPYLKELRTLVKGEGKRL